MNISLRRREQLSHDNPLFGEVGDFGRRLQFVNPVLLIRYEDLLSEPQAIIDKILTFLEIDPKIPLKEISDATCFKNLSNMEKQNGFSEKVHSDNFFRVGQARQWEQGDPRFKPLVDAYSKTLLKLGYEIT